MRDSTPRTRGKIDFGTRQPTRQGRDLLCDSGGGLGRRKRPFSLSGPSQYFPTPHRTGCTVSTISTTRRVLGRVSVPRFYICMNNTWGKILEKSESWVQGQGWMEPSSLLFSLEKRNELGDTQASLRLLPASGKGSAVCSTFNTAFLSSCFW